MSENKFPTEIIDLPSEGRLYPKEHPCYNGKIEIKYMTAKEEDILSNANFIQNGTVIDKLLKSLITSPIDYNELLAGDKNALLVAARILGYGPEYEFSFRGEKLNIDLSSLEDKELDESAFNVWRPCIERNNKIRIENNILFRTCRDGRDWHEYINYINF